MNIVVLAGGNSSERDVSIVSGTQVCKALRSLKHAAVLADVCFGAAGMGKEADPSWLFNAEDYDVDEAAAWMREQSVRLGEISSRRSFFGYGVLEMCKAADIVFMALHGQNGEDGKIQAAFELLGIRYTGCTYLGSALAMDKEITKQLFIHHGVPTPEGIIVRRGEAVLPPSTNGVGLPCVVKPSCGGSSVGVSIANTEEEYRKAVNDAFALERVLVVERCIKGREFSVGVVDNEVYPVIEIAPIQGFYDYTNKYKAGSTIETCPADLSPELTRKMQTTVLDAYHALRLDGYGRIDVMMDEDENIYCLEANTLPGMTPTSLLPQEAAAKGEDFPHLCEKLIQLGLRRE